MSLSTAHLKASEIMKSAAALMNDPQMTDYTYVTMLPYLNLAIDELNENLEEGNISATNKVSTILDVFIGTNQIYNPPVDIVEIQEVGERRKGSKDAFIKLPRKEFNEIYPASSSLLYWSWRSQRIYFNPNGANEDKEVQLNYTGRPINAVLNEDAVIGNSNASSFLTYKTAALLAMFVGENETRANILARQAELSMERIEGISNKGKQQMMTRHRPFRAGYKARGY